MENTGIVNDIVNEIVTCGRVFSLIFISHIPCFTVVVGTLFIVNSYCRASCSESVCY